MTFKDVTLRSPHLQVKRIAKMERIVPRRPFFMLHFCGFPVDCGPTDRKQHRKDGKQQEKRKVLSGLVPVFSADFTGPDAGRLK